MATLLADPPAQSDGQQSPLPGGPPAPAAGSSPQRACANCAAPLAAGQDWCLQCGAGAPGSLRGHSGQWRAGAAVLSALALLIAGAAAAAYAALSKSSGSRRPPVVALARTPALGSTPPPATALPPAASATPTPAVPKLVTPPTVKPAVPLVKPATIPLTGAGAKPPAASTTPAAGRTNTSGATKTGAGSTSTPEKQPTALTLDTNAASTYNPYSYPASNFGDPSLAIDGEAATAWTARLEPSVAPRMAEGLLIDLKTPQRFSALALTTTTPGMSIQIYGAVGAAAPASITDPAWMRLSGLLVAKKRVTRIAMANPKHAFRFVALWISKAPASAVGTPDAPGHVNVNELELFPAR